MDDIKKNEFNKLFKYLMDWDCSICEEKDCNTFGKTTCTVRVFDAARIIFKFLEENKHETAGK